MSSVKTFFTGSDSGDTLALLVTAMTIVAVAGAGVGVVPTDSSTGSLAVEDGTADGAWVLGSAISYGYAISQGDATGVMVAYVVSHIGLIGLAAGGGPVTAVAA